MTSQARRARRVHDVTANYFFWQGLRWIPLGIAILLITPAALEPAWWPERYEGLIIFLLLVLSFAAQWPIGAYYRRRFGVVRPMPGMHARRDRIKWLVVYPAMFGAMMVDALLEPPVFLSGIVFGVGVVAYWYSTGRGRHHYLVFAAALAGVTLVSAVGLLEGNEAAFTLFFVVVGLAYVVGGILDHVALVRFFESGPQENPAGWDLSAPGPSSYH